MSHWNLRVVKQVQPDGSEWYTVREVHYNDDDSIYAYTVDAVGVAGESIEELRQYVQWILDCLDKPVLVDGEVEFVNRDQARADFGGQAKTEI
jgi:tetrahydromethanopterin S-methyltransferase subunit H